MRVHIDTRSTVFKPLILQVLFGRVSTILKLGSRGAQQLNGNFQRYVAVRTLEMIKSLVVTLGAEDQSLKSPVSENCTHQARRGCEETDR
jgi:hypothetical protein